MKTSVKLLVAGEETPRLTGHCHGKEQAWTFEGYNSHLQ